MENDKWMWSPESRRRMRGKTRLTSLEQPSAPTANTSPDTAQQESKEDHDDKRRRIDEPESSVPTAAQDEVFVPRHETFDSVTRDDEIAVDVPLPEETAEMSGENSQGWITEEAFSTVSPGARQVRQRKEVKMNQLSPAERHEFLKSMEVECAGRIVRWTLVGPVPGSQTTASHRGDVPRQDSLSKVSQTLTSLTSSHILRHLPGWAFMTVLQSVCSHGHKLQFGDEKEAFNTGDPIKRKEPLFVRMPPDGVPGKSRGVWVQLLKTVNGLADGTREWRNCFLAAARGLGFETSVLELCVEVLRMTQKKTWHRWGGRRQYCW